jgi:hypothetical protein
MLIVWQIQAVPQYQLNLCNTNNHQDGHCLSYHSHERYEHFTDVHYEVTEIEQIMSYCVRPAEKNYSVVMLDFQNSTDPSFTFAELKQKNITSQMLLSWSASIDMAERYQIFLNNYSNSSSEKEVIFYNCTSSWFGPFCQFAFDYQMDEPFNDTVLSIFQSKRVVREGVRITCYKHLTCQTLLSCLDWREICDGKKDCLDASDEDNCWQLELNECPESEYRCHNGQCIPIEFLRDISDQPDCLDGTDEGPYALQGCYNSPNFHCEEHMCQPGGDEFPCGDGECAKELFKCQNGRNSFLPSNFCFNDTACSVKLYDQVDYKWCLLFCSETNCVKDNCSMVYEFRDFLLLFGHVHFMFSQKNSNYYEIILPDYVCYDVKLCPHFPPPTEQFDNMTCRPFSDLKLPNTDSYNNWDTALNDIKNRFRGCLTTTNEIHYCNYSTMYQCENSSKCISKHRLLDGIRDCPFNDDETFNESCSLNDIRQRFKCKDEENEKCFTLLIVQNGKKECKYGEDEYNVAEAFARTHITFQTTCNGKTELPPILIDGQYETDETNCEHWPCNNTYTRCDNFWLCENGADEINCPYSTCPERHHDCVFLNDTSKVSCLPIARAGDGVDHCLGGTDERIKYRLDNWLNDSGIAFNNFHCWNDTEVIPVGHLCDNTTDCRFNDDEVFCKISASLDWILCMMPEQPLKDVENFFCNFGRMIIRSSLIYFRLSNILNYPLGLATDNISIASSTRTKTRSIEIDLKTNLPSDLAWWCNRGVPIRLRLNDNTSTLSCLCPPSYYGDTCQYQNQRVSLTLQVRAASDWRSIFVFLITLIDNERNIQSHDHVEYLPIRDCKTKFNIYLLYSTRPKNSSKTYSVKIDAFNEKALKYRASWIFHLRFSFLPVHRLAVLLKVPFSNAIFAQQKCLPPCIHGQCFHHVNDQNSTFCHCEPGWSGIQCDVEHKCDCAPDSLCISDSICLCPPGRFGSRCHLIQVSSELCMNGGKWAPVDVRYTSFNAIRSMCICPEGYVGDRCEHQQRQTRIDISFHHKLTIPSSLLVHFIAVQLYGKHNRTSIMKKIAFDQYSLTVYTSTLFNIALAQILSQYYLIILHEQTIVSAHIPTKIIPSHRCPSIGELFNETFANQHLLKRIKYYHLPCREQTELVCFYDDVHFCLCTLDRTANCFEFDHNMTYDCGGYNYCENEGHCFKDDPICGTSSICVCLLCYFGSSCQFSTKGSALSLDIILGYHIRSKTEISQQPTIVKVAIALITTMSTFGFINSVLSFQTFRGKQTRCVGCGLYLFTVSIISMIIVIVLTFKFAFLVASRIGSISNRSFLYLQCALTDFILRSLLSTSDWFSACVAIERAVNVIQGIKFNKAKSKKMAKLMIFIVLLFTSCSYIYDPIHRRLIDDEEEQRTWCVSQYSSSVQVFDWLLNIFHFSVPFAINCISALTVIIIAARTRSNSQKTKSFKEHLREQIHHHKHLLISPLILIVLALPRLVISFLSGCMKSARDSWLYLIGYFISFIPSIMTFIVFVLPSEMYKKELNDSLKWIWQR